MKNNLKAIILLLSVLIIISCKKPGRGLEVENPIKNPPPKEHGSLIAGTAVQKTIGAAGGVIESVNSTVKVTIPAGAIDKDTPFIIQEVTNTYGDNNLGKVYRLSPENIKFKKEVEISYTYTNEMLVGKVEDFLFLAYQDAKGYWRVPKNVQLNKANKTLTVQTNHFSDWSGFCSASLKVDKEKLKVNEESTITGKYLIRSEDVEELGVDDILGTPKIADKEHIDEWKIVLGPGQINPKDDGTCVFKAPSSLQEPVSVKIQLRFKNIRNPRTDAEGLVLAYTDILLTPDEYIAWTFAQNTRSAGKDLIVKSWADNQKTSPLFSVGNTFAFSFNGIKTGEFKFGPSTNTGFSHIGVNSQTPNTPFYFGFRDCSGVVTYNDGGVIVESIKDGYIEGKFYGKLNQLWPNTCRDEYDYINGAFRLKLPD